MRIVSLLPSATEIICEQIQLQAALYSLDMPVLEKLDPDLIVSPSVCDVCAVAESEVQAAACSLPGSPQVINLKPTCLADVMQGIGEVGTASGQDAAAESCLAELQHRVDRVARRSESITNRPPCRPERRAPVASIVITSVAERLPERLHPSDRLTRSRRRRLT